MNDYDDLQAEVEAVYAVNSHRPGHILVTPEEAVAALADQLRAGKAGQQWSKAFFLEKEAQERIAALKADNAKLREALGFYAKISWDDGQFAREALAATEQEASDER